MSCWPLSTWKKLQEYFQGLESHMILTETLFRKIISFAIGQETQFHTEVMAQASAVLKGAHKRGVELEYILEVRCFMEHHVAQQTVGASRVPVPFASHHLGTLWGSASRIVLSRLYFLFVFQQGQCHMVSQLHEYWLQTGHVDIWGLLDSQAETLLTFAMNFFFSVYNMFVFF